VRAAKRTPPAPRGAGVITSLVAKRGRSDRVAIYVDGSLLFDVAAVVADNAGLRHGLVLEVGDQESLAERDAPFRARDKALRLLELRDRCRREIEGRLRASGFDEAVIAATVRWLQDLDYVNDRRFAAHYAAERLRGGWGARRIRADLLRKGTEREAVEEALEAVDGESESGPAETDVIVALARKRFGVQFHTDPVTAKRRLSGFLARRGYDWDVIDKVAKIVGGEASGEDDLGR
jgi:regulatory protein